MLIKISVENFKSFDEAMEISMISFGKIQSHRTHRLQIKQTRLLKNAVIYGANASGKSNIVKAVAFMQAVLMDGLPMGSVRDFCRNREANTKRDSRFELQFTVGSTFYAYGFSARLAEGVITGEWLYELLQDGTAKLLFSRDDDQQPLLGDAVKAAAAEKRRFEVYAEDFAGPSGQLFLTELNRGKKYAATSKLRFLTDVFGWLTRHIIVIDPNRGISNTETYYDEASLQRVSDLIRTFDTGITAVRTQAISLEDMQRVIPKDMMATIMKLIRRQMEVSRTDVGQLTLRFQNGFYHIRVKGNGEPDIRTLMLRHGKSASEFTFGEESEGTQRLFDLLAMILTEKTDTVFVVDELERSLHPKVTEHFLRLFMAAHEGEKVQLLFTTHEDTIMNQDLFRRDEIWFVERNAHHASRVYSLDRFKERYDKKLSKAYLDGRYGAIPVFREWPSAKEG